MTRHPAPEWKQDVAREDDDPSVGKRRRKAVLEVIALLPGIWWRGPGVAHEQPNPKSES